LINNLGLPNQKYLSAWDLVLSIYSKSIQFRKDNVFTKPFLGRSVNGFVVNNDYFTISTQMHVELNAVCMSNAFGRTNVFSGSYPLRHDVQF
jgi:hypothetical protein